MKKFLILPGFLAGLLVAPLAVQAQGDLQGVITVFSDLINLAIPLVLALAVLYFFWGLAMFVLAQGNEDKRKEGRDIMIYGIIALFVMVSVWGLIGILQDTFGVDNTNPIVPEEIRR